MKKGVVTTLLDCEGRTTILYKNQGIEPETSHYDQQYHSQTCLKKVNLIGLQSLNLFSRN